MVGGFLRSGNWRVLGAKPAVATLWPVCCKAQKLLWFDHACNTGRVVEHIRCGFWSWIRCPGSHLTSAPKRIPALDGLKRLALLGTAHLAARLRQNKGPTALRTR